MVNADGAHRHETELAKEREITKQLEIVREIEIRKMRLAIKFAKYGFYGTLFGGLLGMLLLTILTFIVVRAELENGGTVIIAVAGFLTVAITAFGYFSLRQSPVIGLGFGNIHFKIGCVDPAPPDGEKAR